MVERKKTLLDVLKVRAEVEKNLEYQLEIRYRIFILESQRELKATLPLLNKVEDAVSHLKAVNRFVDELENKSLLGNKPTKTVQNEYDDFFNKIYYMFHNVLITDTTKYQNEILEKLDRAIKIWYCYRNEKMPL